MHLDLIVQELLEDITLVPYILIVTIIRRFLKSKMVF